MKNIKQLAKEIGVPMQIATPFSLQKSQFINENGIEVQNRFSKKLVCASILINHGHAYALVDPRVHEEMKTHLGHTKWSSKPTTATCVAPTCNVGIILKSAGMETESILDYVNHISKQHRLTSD